MEVLEAKNWYKELSSKNKELSKVVKGVDLKTNSVIVNNNKSIPMDEFSKMSTPDDVQLYLTSNNKEVIPTQTMPEEKNTLNDLSILTEVNNKDAINRILEKNCKDPNTGIFEIGKYFNTFYDNTKKEVVSSIMNNYELSSDLNDYSVDGKFIGEKIQGNTNDILKISQGVKNNVVSLKAIGTNTDRVKIDDNYINLVKNKFINETTAEVNLLKNKNNVVEKEPVKEVVKEEKTSESSNNDGSIGNKGIADVFVLTAIILVYAVIIINLIMKLK